MTVDELFDEFEKDTEFSDDFGHDAKRVTFLRNKYHRLLVSAKRKVRKYQDDLENLEFAKRLYYDGKASPEVYKKKPFNYKVTKGEIPMWIKADQEVVAVKKDLAKYIELKEILEEFLDQLRWRKNQIDTIIDWKKFLAGE